MRQQHPILRYSYGHVRCLAGPMPSSLRLQNATGREAAEATHPTCESRKHCRHKAGKKPLHMPLPMSQCRCGLTQSSS